MPNVVSETLPVSSMTKIKIVEQIEYYFGDYNMMRDKFLKEEVAKHEGGYVAIKTLLTFNRLVALTTDPKVILEAFMENPSDVVEIDATGERIRRKPGRAIPEADENWRNSVMQRSVYIKGFPPETTTIGDIIPFMGTFGKIENVFMRKYYDKALRLWKFKGSVFVAFPTREDAEKFIDIKSLRFGGNELIIKWQKDYIEEKKAERLKDKLKLKEQKAKLLEEEMKAKNGVNKKLPTGALIELTGLNSEISTTKLKQSLIDNHDWNVSFINHTAGEANAYVRLQEKDSAKAAVDKLTDGAFTFQDMTLKATVVEGDKEKEILEKMESDKNTRMMQLMNKHKGCKKFKGGHKRGGKQDKNVHMKSSTIKTEMLDSTKDEKPIIVKTEPVDDSHEGRNTEQTNAPCSMSGDTTNGESVLKRKSGENTDEVTKKIKSEY